MKLIEKFGAWLQNRMMRGPTRVLKVLAKSPVPLSGSDIVKEDRDLSMGSVFNHLYVLHERGYVDSKLGKDPSAVVQRRWYTITQRGIEFLKENT